MQEKVEDGYQRTSPVRKNGNKPRGVLSSDDNARHHTARGTKEHIRRLGWERLDHSAYRLDLTPVRLSPFPCIEVSTMGT
ncbi:hypothetical protein AVEN_47004-1 [Araneus ventricosus]|uniref:Tc1-like transposase DDE domain-containing protein n=1 Tax=Araneus ventricosus TaxID=182803 RepID=A0A4Y2IGA9_ARAVE|nr:hypothetical protein AVEN_47004-1 [Araneus ventricosus]